MERKKFIKTFCITAVGLPLMGMGLDSCQAIHYATAAKKDNKLIVSRAEFIFEQKGEVKNRKFILLRINTENFPICIYNEMEGVFTSSLLKCTHRGCELNVGGGIYTCPCHGSEFTIKGEVLEGPADQNLKTYTTTSDNENIYIQLS